MDVQRDQGIANLKLDTIKLQIFNGNLADWEAFRDMFKYYLVDRSKKMSKVVKLYQLRTHLEGAAFDCIRGYKPNGSNYDAAWADVKKR